jgi:hypothetical protein
VFETPKSDNVPFVGIELLWGGAFTQQFQGLSHQNSAAPNVVAGVDANKLITIGHGFNNAVANLNRSRTATSSWMPRRSTTRT